MSWNNHLNGYLINYTNQNNGLTLNNLSENAAMIGIDGNLWAATPGFSLSKYSAPVVNDDGTSSMAQLDELATLHDVFENHGATSRPGGIRINNEKYFIVAYDPERSVLYLRKQNGGACVAKSNTAYVIGTFSASLKMNDSSRGQIQQNPGAINLACESLQEFLLAMNL